MVYLLLDGTEIDINQLLLDYSKLKLHVSAFYNKQNFTINLILLFMFMWKRYAMSIWCIHVLDMVELTENVPTYLV